MSISGLLATMNLPEILQWIKFGQKTGTVIFEHRGIVKKVYIEDGLIVSASSNDPKEYLGQILMCYGWIDEKGLSDAFELQAKTHKLLGKIMIDHFHLEQKQILQALKVKIEETVYDIFIWEDGRFIYADGLMDLQEHDRLDTAITIDQVIFEGARRLDEWRAFRQQFPADDVVFALKGGQRDLGDLKGDFFIETTYRLIDGSRSMRRILLEARLPEYRGIEAFTKLFMGAFIEPIKKTAKTAKLEAPDEGSVLRQATEMFKAKQLDQAFVLLEQFIGVKPDHAEGQTLYKMVRENYVKELYRVCSPDSIPELKIDISDLSEKIFSSREGFLASRINGQWDVKSLIMISPLGDLDTLKILKRLLDEGIIRWKK